MMAIQNSTMRPPLQGMAALTHKACKLQLRCAINRCFHQLTSSGPDSRGTCLLLWASEQINLAPAPIFTFLTCFLLQQRHYTSNEQVAAETIGMPIGAYSITQVSLRDYWQRQKHAWLLCDADTGIADLSVLLEIYPNGAQGCFGDAFMCSGLKPQVLSSCRWQQLSHTGSKGLRKLTCMAVMRLYQLS